MGYKVGDEVLVKVAFSRYSDDYATFKFTGLDGMCYEICPSPKIICKEPEMTAEEAWDIAKKLFADYSNTKLDNIFGKGWSFPKLMELTPQEVKSRIEAWEAEKEIKVGDVVIRCGESCIVTNKSRDDGFYDVLFEDGTTGAYQRSSLKKTGRHIGIEGILKQIGGDE